MKNSVYVTIFGWLYHAFLDTFPRWNKCPLQCTIKWNPYSEKLNSIYKNKMLTCRLVWKELTILLWRKKWRMEKKDERNEKDEQWKRYINKNIIIKKLSTAQETNTCHWQKNHHSVLYPAVWLQNSCSSLAEQCVHFFGPFSSGLTSFGQIFFLVNFRSVIYLSNDNIRMFLVMSIDSKKNKTNMSFCNSHFSTIDPFLADFFLKNIRIYLWTQHAFIVHFQTMCANYDMWFL